MIISKKYEEMDPKNIENVKEIHKILQSKNKINPKQDLISWLIDQEVIFRIPFQSFFFWLWQQKIIDYIVFEKIHDELTPVTSKSWSYPLIITKGTDDPLLEGGFIDHEFSIFQYKFIPSNHGFLLECQIFPKLTSTTNLNPDSILSFFSFVLEKSNYGYLGFRQIKARKFENTKTEAIEGGVGPEIRIVEDFDFSIFEGVLHRLENLPTNEDFSIFELLNIRHRAINDSSNESKLITLWSYIEAQWGNIDKEDSLFSNEEKEDIKKGLKKILKVEKYKKAIEVVFKLKNKTQKEKIIERISYFLSENYMFIKGEIDSIYLLRNKVAHGDLLNPDEEKELATLIPFLFRIINVQISLKMEEVSIHIN